MYRLIIALAAGALLAGCASTKPVDFQGLSSASVMQQNPQKSEVHMPYYYAAPGINLANYRQVIFDPVTVYQGQDQQFGKLDTAQRAQLAAYMQERFTQALAARYALVTAPGPHALRIHVTLTGASASVPVLSTVKQILPVAAVVSTAKSAMDKQSRSLGQVSYAVEIYDSQSGKLLRAFVALQYPAAENLSASIGTFSAAKTGIDKGAKLLPEQLD